MDLFQTPPEGGPAKRRTHWKHVNVRNKERWDAHTAGNVHWYTCHDVAKKTKPCLTVVTGGAVPCPFCARLMERMVCGYVPLWRAVDGWPVHVRVYDDARAELDALKLHTRVMVGRGPMPGDTVYVMKYSEQTPVFKSADPEKFKPQSLTVSLLKLWGIPELVGWFKDKTGQDLPPNKNQPKEVKPANPVAEKIAEGERATLKDWVDVTLGAAQERSAQWVENVRKGEAAARRNGKPKPSE